MSVTQLTTISAWIAGLAIVALMAAGWRKPARATATIPRARRAVRRSSITLEEDVTPLHHGTPWWRRVIAVVGSSVIGVVIGAALATVISFGVAWTVITLTSMLRQ